MDKKASFSLTSVQQKPVLCNETFGKSTPKDEKVPFSNESSHQNRNVFNDRFLADLFMEQHEQM